MKKLLLSLACVLCSTTAHAAPVVIDSFDSTGFQVVGAPTLGGSSLNPATSSGATVDAIGGVRTITNTRTFPPGTQNAFGSQVQTVVTGGSASVSLASGVSGFSVFSYNAGGADLTDGGLNDAVELSVLSTDLGVTFTLGFAGSSVTRAAGGAGTLSFGFADFGGTDFTNIDAISLLISGPSAFDTTFDQIQAVGPVVTDPPVSPVPLPAGLPLLLGALGAFGLCKRRKA